MEPVRVKFVKRQFKYEKFGRVSQLRIIQCPSAEPGLPTSTDILFKRQEGYPVLAHLMEMLQPCPRNAHSRVGDHLQLISFNLKYLHCL